MFLNIYNGKIYKTLLYNTTISIDHKYLLLYRPQLKVRGQSNQIKD